jgi:hypothetical protein
MDKKRPAKTPPVAPVPAPKAPAKYEPPRLIKFQKLERLMVAGE